MYVTEADKSKSSQLPVKMSRILLIQENTPFTFMIKVTSDLTHFQKSIILTVSSNTSFLALIMGADGMLRTLCIM